MTALAAWPECQGMLAVEDQSVSVTCSVEFSQQGELLLAFDDIPLDRQNACLLHAAQSDDGPFVRLFTVQLLTANGETLKSERVYVTAVSTPFAQGRRTLRLSAKADALETIVGPADRSFIGEVHQLRYFTLGMLGFGRVRGECTEGDIVVEGPHEEPSDTILSGQVHLRRVGVVDSDAWISACDKRVLSTLRVLSLAQGRPIEWAVCEHFVDRQRARSRFFAAPSLHPSAEALFTHLELQPTLDLALRNHDRLLDQELRLGEAIDWVVQWHVLAEIRLLTAITAFEGLLAGHSSANGGLVPTACFRDHVRPRFEAVLSAPEVRDAVTVAFDPDITALQVDAILHEISTKLGSLNQRSLPTRLADFLRHYNVPINDLSISLVELLRTRNRVIHGGSIVASAYEDRTTGRAAMMREVLRRTILAMLGYSGHFYSYLKERQWLTFGALPTHAAFYE